MKEAVQQLFEAVSDLRNKADVGAAFGEPVTIEGRTVIPIARIGYAFGLGFGVSEPQGEEASEEDVGAGEGGAAFSHPVGVLEVTEGDVRIRPFVDEQKIAVAGVFLVGWLIFWIAHTLTKIFGKE